MKEKFSLAVDVLMCAALVISLFWCLSSAFDISVKWILVIIPTAIFCTVYALLARLVKKTRILFACVGVTVLVFALSLVFSFSDILSQLGYVLTQIFAEYSKYLALPESVTFGDKVSYAANGLFVFVSALLSAAFTVSLVRYRKIFVIAVLSVALLIPDFILVNTLPEIVPLFAAVGILFTLYITRSVRKFRPSQRGAVSLGALAAVLAVMAVVLALNPVDTYVRSDWQEELLAGAEDLFNIEGGERSVLDKAESSLEKTQNLSDVSELVQTHTPKMTVTSTQKSGNMYLFGTAYANYSDNTWSVLTDKQKASYSGQLNPFTLSSSIGETVTTRVHMLGSGSLMYFPYYTSEFSDGCENLYDICMAGSLGDYEYTHSKLGGDEYLNWADSDYTSFVIGSVYRQIPDDTKNALLEAARQNDWFNSLTEGTTQLYGSVTSKSFSIDVSELTEYYDTQTIADAVKSVVSQSAAYSLDVPQMPSGKDFPVWFLTESSTGYCVHFATSAVLLLRSLGVPARYVTGYYFTLVGGVATVTSDNAHAWAEYYDESRGWVPLECTPSGFTPDIYTGNTEGSSLSIYATQQPTQDAADSTEQPTAAVQPTTAEPTTASSADGQTASQGGGTSSGSTAGLSEDSDGFVFEWNAVTITLLALAAIALAVVIIFLRRIMILFLRKKRMSSGTANKRAVEAYREILKLARKSHIYVAPEIEEIYERARFSNHKISESELEKITEFYYDSVKEIYNNCAWYKRIYLKFIAVV